MSDDTRTGGAAGAESTLDTPFAGTPDTANHAPAVIGDATTGETADLRADALADAASYVPGSDGVTASGTIVIATTARDHTTRHHKYKYRLTYPYGTTWINGLHREFPTLAINVVPTTDVNHHR